MPPDTGWGIETTDISHAERTWEEARLHRTDAPARVAQSAQAFREQGGPREAQRGWGGALCAWRLPSRRVCGWKGPALIQRFKYPHVAATARRCPMCDRALQQQWFEALFITLLL